MLKNTKNISKSELELEFEMDAEEFKSFFNKALTQLSKELEVKGFRKGNVPLEVAKEHLNKDTILSKAAELAAQKEYNQYLLDNDIEPVSAPELSVTKLAENNPFVFNLKVNCLSDLELPDYKKIAKGVEKKKVEVKEDEVQQTLDWIQKTRAKKTPKQEPAKKGDFVEIEYDSTQTGKQKDGFVLGEGKLIPGLEDKLVGINPGEEKEVKITVPKDYKVKEIAGKELTFQVKMNSVSQIEKPELNEEFIKTLGNFESLDNLKNNIRQGIEQEKQQSEKEKRRAEILKQIGEKTNGEIPPALVEKEKQTLLTNLKEQIKNKVSLSFEEYLKRINKTEKSVIDSLQAEAEKRVKQILILKQIGKQEGIEATEQEIKEESDKILKKYENTEQAKNNIDEERLRVYTKDAVKSEKVLQLLENL